MDALVTLRPQLPHLRELASYSGRIAQGGAQPLPQIELQTRMPNLGPYTMGNTGFYDLQIYPGPLLRVVTAAPTGQTINTSA
jgi:hypothetical protein